MNPATKGKASVVNSFILNKFLRDTQRTIEFETQFGHYKFQEVRPKIRCVSGLEISVQASHLHYCMPRDDNGPYTHVEIGFPTEVIDELLEYAEDRERPTDTVYAYVPIELVQQVIDNHGGIEGTSDDDFTIG
jgi:hypothetical protein